MAAVTPPASQIGAKAQAQHEDGRDQGRGVDRVAKDVGELPHPDDLVDQPGDPREEEEDVDANPPVRLSGQANPRRA